jgi:hypothetical protein
MDTDILNRTSIESMTTSGGSRLRLPRDFPSVFERIHYHADNIYIVYWDINPETNSTE